MSQNVLQRPESSEFASFAKRYVDAVPPGDLLELLEQQPLAVLLGGVTEDWATNFVYAPGKWTAKQTLGHVSDTERIFAYRILRASRGDGTPLPGFEQDDYVAAARSNERSLASLLGEFTAVRQATIHLLKSLGAEDWTRRGSASGFEWSVRGIAFALTGHELHHLQILRERYLKES
jgi:hypothetical protein